MDLKFGIRCKTWAKVFHGRRAGRRNRHEPPCVFGSGLKLPKWLGVPWRVGRTLWVSRFHLS